MTCHNPRSAGKHSRAVPVPPRTAPAPTSTAATTRHMRRTAGHGTMGHRLGGRTAGGRRPPSHSASSPSARPRARSPRPSPRSRPVPGHAPPAAGRLDALPGRPALQCGTVSVPIDYDHPPWSLHLWPSPGSLRSTPATGRTPCCSTPVARARAATRFFPCPRLASRRHTPGALRRRELRPRGHRGQRSAPVRYLPVGASPAWAPSPAGPGRPLPGTPCMHGHGPGLRGPGGRDRRPSSIPSTPPATWTGSARRWA